MVPISNLFGLHKCGVCSATISRQANWCPKCGDPKKAARQFEIPTLFYFVAIIYLIIGGVACLKFGAEILNYLSHL